MATKTKRLRVLNEVYAPLPSIKCKGLCWHSCSHILVMPAEKMNLEQHTGKPVPTVHAEGPWGTEMLDPMPHGHCPYLVMRRCSVYEARPFICRIYGVAEGLRCPHGCEPDGIVPDKEVEKLIGKLTKL